MTARYATRVPAGLVLLGLLAAGSAAGNETLPGQALFYTHCATCHVGAGALMGMRPPPDLFRDPLGIGDSAAAISAVIQAGAGGGRMPPFRDGFDDAELRALVTYIRSQRQR